MRQGTINTTTQSKNITTQRVIARMVRSWSSTVTSHDGTDRPAVVAANQAFYAAHEARDLAAMRRVWEHSDRTVCIHPGWPILRRPPPRPGRVRRGRQRRPRRRDGRVEAPASRVASRRSLPRCRSVPVLPERWRVADRSESDLRQLPGQTAVPSRGARLTRLRRSRRVGRHLKS